MPVSRGIFPLFLALAFIISVVAVAAGDDVMTVEADILDVGNSSENGTISIQVPDFIDLGNLSEIGASEELKIYVNNTGTGAITVTPRLVNYTDNIFQNLYFREFKTSGGNPVIPIQIGNWSFNISAPAGGESFRSKYFYMQLDLSDAGIDVSSDLIGHQTHVRFFATLR